MFLLITCTLLLSVSLCTGIPDFEDVDGDFSFFYHDFHELLVTVYSPSSQTAGGPQGGDGCYFTLIDSHLKDPLLTTFRNNTEKRVRDAILSASDSRIHSTTPAEMRDKFEDRLADFICHSKQVFVLSVDFLGNSFDDGLWLWRQSQTDDMDWILHSGQTSTVLTGPDTDHTTHTGQYIYMEANNGSPNQVAEIESPAFVLTDPMCVRFWYFMYGRSVGSLEVYQVHENKKSKLYSVKGDHGQTWRDGEVSVRPTTASQSDVISIGFRAIRGSGIYGDIAVDDVTTIPGVCVTEMVDCDFEQPGPSEFCEWSQGVRSMVSWHLHKGATPTLRTGPDYDHTLGSGGQGHYVYMEANEGRPNDYAELVSPILPLQGPMCLTFWYHMQGDSVGQLSVYFRHVQTRQTDLIWSVQGPQGADWVKSKVTIVPPTNDDRVQIIIRATRGDSIESDIAVDDITGSSGICV